MQPVVINHGHGTVSEKEVVKSIQRPKSLYRSRAGSHFYGTEYEIWADFRPVGNTEKKHWAVNYATFRVFFYVSKGKFLFCF